MELGHPIFEYIGIFCTGCPALEYCPADSRSRGLLSSFSSADSLEAPVGGLACVIGPPKFSIFDGGVEEGPVFCFLPSAMKLPTTTWENKYTI